MTVLTVKSDKKSTRLVMVRGFSFFEESWMKKKHINRTKIYLK